MKKHLSPFLQRLITLLLIGLLIVSCQVRQEAADAPLTPDLPSIPNNETLLSSQLDPTGDYLAMVFAEELEDDFAQNKTNIRVYRREDKSEWGFIDSVVLFEEGRKSFSISSVAFLPLGAQSGFLVETEAGRMGTAKAGLTERDYIFYVPGSASASVYRYVKWLRQEGELELVQPGSGDFRGYLSRKLAGGEASSAEADTFQRAWLAHNEHLYEQMDSTNTWFEIRFPDYSPALMDSFPSDNQLSSGDLRVVGGFAHPILAYSKKADRTFSLWVPAGWPNGGGWGFRSLYVEEVSRDGHVTVSNRDDVHILLDFPRQRVLFLDRLGVD